VTQTSRVVSINFKQQDWTWCGARTNTLLRSEASEASPACLNGKNRTLDFLRKCFRVVQGSLGRIPEEAHAEIVTPFPRASKDGSTHLCFLRRSCETTRQVARARLRAVECRLVWHLRYLHRCDPLTHDALIRLLHRVVVANRAIRGSKRLRVPVLH
jgi:hypothetical protein